MRHRFSILPNISRKRSLSMKELETKNTEQGSLDIIANRLKSRALSKFFCEKIPPAILSHKNCFNKNPPVIREPLIENHYNRKLESKKPLYRSSSSLLSKLNNNPNSDIQKDVYYNHLHNYFVEKGYKTKDTSLCQTKRDNSNMITNYFNDNMSQSASFFQIESKTQRTIHKPIPNKDTKIFLSPDYDKDYLAEMIITRYVNTKSPKQINSQHRSLFIILDGTVVINDNVNGIFINIPIHSSIQSMNKKQRNKIAMALLKKCSLAFQTHQNLIAIYNYAKEPIYDLIELGINQKYIYVSNKHICSGINLMPSNHFLKLYNKNYDTFIKEKRIKKDKSESNSIQLKQKAVLAKKINNTWILNDKYNKKRDKSYSEGCTNETSIYDYYSDNEDRKNKAMKQIKAADCQSKYDFYAYLTKNELEEKVNDINKRLNFTQKNPFNLSKLFKNYKCDFDTVLARFLKEQNINIKDQPIVKNKKNKIDIDEFCVNLDIHNLQYSKKRYDIINKPKDKYPYITRNAQKTTFYHNLDKNISKKYPDFFSYNVPKFLSKFKKFDRKQLYQTFGTYKMLIALCYGLNQSELIIDNGVDFETFWKCVREISSEKKEFVEKLFTQINKTKSNLLSIYEFFEGMMFIQSTDLKEKLDLFLKTLDQSGKGILSYDDVINICTESINRNLCNEKSDKQSDNESLTLLSTFFAEFIFQLLEIDKKELLPLEKIKNAIVQGSIETQYLEMFCGANKIAK